MSLPKQELAVDKGTGTAAFFDFDGTLINFNSGNQWIKAEYRRRKLTARKVAQGLLYIGLYKLSLVDMPIAMQQALAVYRGDSEEELERLTQKWFESEIAFRITSEAREKLAEHRRLGHRLILLTSSSPYLSRQIGRYLNLDHCISSVYEVVDGKFTGEFVAPLCYGQGKVQLAEKYAAKHEVDLGQSYFYTDSLTDLPMLQRVGYPQIVNPDMRLKRFAQRRGWPILHWQTELSNPSR